MWLCTFYFLLCFAVFFRFSAAAVGIVIIWNKSLRFVIGFCFCFLKLRRHSQAYRSALSASRVRCPCKAMELHTVLSNLEVIWSFSHFVICLLILYGVLDTQTFFTAVFLLEFRQAFTFLENRNVTAEIISMLLGWVIKPVEINASLLLLSLESGPLSCLCKKQLCGLQSEDLPFEDSGLSPERALVFLVHRVRAHGIRRGCWLCFSVSSSGDHCTDLPCQFLICRWLD